MALESGDEYIRYALQKVKKLAGNESYEAVKTALNAIFNEYGDCPPNDRVNKGILTNEQRTEPYIGTME
jgi:hypothetical protein